MGNAVNDHWYDWAVVLYAYILGLCLGLVFSTAMGVGVSTLFVCMSEDITKLQAIKPEFSEFIQNYYKEMFDFLVLKSEGKAIEEQGSNFKKELKEESFGAAAEKGKR
ncbi:hypothetical protein BD324DRAFT_631948 [Kockovaella imperatae]|uniref:Uncharacterized protein n=1 Tax=Kockovaella imperatae TaxID=4999 RepID=A0A1Y1UB46_9TREE|nr:hypothetical protein BD324DRAFT_631948 [Kockovaella imperatae]ORX35239.1 hypothetical protein BD324DRAFT_631948 [Kockovaella imperatae]